MQLSLEAIKHVGAPSSYYREPRGVSAGDIYFDDYSFRPVKESSYKIVRAAHFVLWTAAAFKTDRAQSFHFWPAAALRQAFRSVSVPRTLTGNATRSPSSLAAKLFPLGAGMSGDFALFIHDVAERGFQCCSGSGGEVFL